MIFTDGATTQIAGLKTVSTTALVPNKEYVFEYGSPAFAYRLISPETVASVIKGWLKMKGQIVSISGISIDTNTGRIRIRAKVVAPPDVQISEAGVNPLAVFAVIAGLFAAIGIGVSLLFVYELTGGSGASGSWSAPSDPCSARGVLNYVRCLARKSSLVATGIGIGALAVFVALLFLAGRAK